MSHTRKLKMGDIEPDAVCYKNGVEANTVAHRQRKDGRPEFSLAELKHLVKCWNCHDPLLAACKDIANLAAIGMTVQVLEQISALGMPEFEGVAGYGYVLLGLQRQAKEAIAQAKKAE